MVGTESVTEREITEVDSIIDLERVHNSLVLLRRGPR